MASVQAQAPFPWAGAAAGLTVGGLLAWRFAAARSLILGPAAEGTAAKAQQGTDEPGMTVPVASASPDGSGGGSSSSSSSSSCSGSRCAGGTVARPASHDREGCAAAPASPNAAAAGVTSGGSSGSTTSADCRTGGPDSHTEGARPGDDGNGWLEGDVTESPEWVVLASDLGVSQDRTELCDWLVGSELQALKEGRRWRGVADSHAADVRRSVEAAVAAAAGEEGVEPSACGQATSEGCMAKALTRAASIIGQTL